MATSALALNDIDAFYGDSHVLQKVSFRLGEGRLLGLLGRNGAGKSTCMNVTVGLLPPRTGTVEVFGTAVTQAAAGADRGARRGAGAAGPPHLQEPVGAGKPGGRGARSPMPAAGMRPGPSTPCSACSRGWPSGKNQIAAHLSGGEQQMLAIGRALMQNPRVLLMDEPSEGLAPQIVAEVMATIRKLKESGLSIVLVEQNPKLVFDIADDIVILNTGQVAVVGAAAELNRDGVDLRQHLGVF